MVVVTKARLIILITILHPIAAVGVVSLGWLDRAKEFPPIVPTNSTDPVNTTSGETN